MAIRYPAKSVRSNPRYFVYRNPSPVFIHPKISSTRFRIRWFTAYPHACWVVRPSMALRRPLVFGGHVGQGNFASLPLPLRSSRASGSVVLWWVHCSASPHESLLRGCPGCHCGLRAGSPSRCRRVFRLAAASINVPSTVKCSSESRPRPWGSDTTSSKSCWPNPVLQQPLAVLGEDRGVKAGSHQVHVHEPSKNQMVVQLFAEGSFATDQVYGDEQRGL